ncbi:hypothetical protein K435DRAFT_812058 [Dendrothele bispora CBS 962.96]|uniref:Uncharacterized protein n=1 Tax=Dendrothele bispora (strain CBS 962.96) TaxID=1314807 RepID=A0A4S8KQ79_DENBC|nr:hypothetical protein K435DRAFT_812058 [Dendrothele bispora CBS 962.96]
MSLRCWYWCSGRGQSFDRVVHHEDKGDINRLRATFTLSVHYLPALDFTFFPTLVLIVIVVTVYVTVEPRGRYSLEDVHSPDFKSYDEGDVRNIEVRRHILKKEDRKTNKGSDCITILMEEINRSDQLRKKDRIVNKGSH